MKEKMKAVLKQMCGNVGNALQAAKSKRAYMVTLVVYFAMSEMESSKLWALSVVGSAYIASETVRHILKQLREVDGK